MPERNAIPRLLIVGAILGCLAAATGGAFLAWSWWPRPVLPSHSDRLSDEVPDGAPVAASGEETKPGPSPEEIKVRQERQARRRSQQNLQKLARAFLEFADTNDSQLPPSALMDRQKPTPLLSWRVLLLPYLGEYKLYREFKLDEPWDGPNNKKLLGRMPKVYAPVRGSTPQPGTTFYQVFVGQEAVFPSPEMLPPPLPGQLLSPGGPRWPASIFDGTSYTLLIVEAGDPVPWTKPTDLLYDASKPLPKLGGLFEDGLHAVAFSGEVYFIPRDFKEKDLRRLVTPRDGEVLETALEPLPERDEAPAAEANPKEESPLYRGKTAEAWLKLIDSSMVAGRADVAARRCTKGPRNTAADSGRPASNVPVDDGFRCHGCQGGV
jgi:hypothetical protein